VENRIKDHVQVDINSITISKVDLTQVNMTIGVEIKNQNWLGFTVDKVVYDIYANQDNELVRLGGGDLLDLHLGAGKSFNGEVPVTISNMQTTRVIVNTGLSILSDFELPEMVVKGTAWVDIGPFTIKKHFTATPESVLG